MISKEKIDKLREKFGVKSDDIIDYIDFIENSYSMYHSTFNAEKRLIEAGFNKLEFTKDWNLKKTGKYYLVINGSTIIAFVVGKDSKSPFHIVGAHTDSPAFKIKSKALLNKEGYNLLNTEVYGGPILNTWYDRPLTIAGRVFTKSEDNYKVEEKLFEIKDDVLTIPSLAIHMTGLNDRGKEPNPQTQMLPILGFKEKLDLNEFIASKMNISKEDILSYELYLTTNEKVSLLCDLELIQAGKLDNLGMMHAGLRAIINAKSSDYTQVFVAFDNEEIGSGTQQGARSTLFKDILKKISYNMGNDELTFINQIYDSYMISADQAHAIHPNYLEKADLTNRPKINQGPVVKWSAGKSYATDSYSEALLNLVSEKANVPLQTFHNRSDMRGGSTIGALIEIATGIKNIDIGNAMLGMHSIRETSGLQDHIYMIDLMREFFEI